MSVHILYDQQKRKSVMYCSTTGQAFGPLFDDDDAAYFVDAQLAIGVDPRELHDSDLAAAIEDWEDAYYGQEAV